MNFFVNLHPLLAQVDYSTSSAPSAATTVGSIIGALIYVALMIVVIAGMWKMFVKAGKPGWAAIVPFYNFIVLLQIAGKPLWWIILLFIPFVNFIIIILVCIALAKSFGKGVGYGIGILLLSFIFIPMLGFGDARYVEPDAAPPLV